MVGEQRQKTPAPAPARASDPTRQLKEFLGDVAGAVEGVRGEVAEIRRTADVLQGELRIVARAAEAAGHAAEGARDAAREGVVQIAEAVGAVLDERSGELTAVAAAQADRVVHAAEDQGRLTRSDVANTATALAEVRTAVGDVGHAVEKDGLATRDTVGRVERAVGDQGRLLRDDVAGAKDTVLREVDIVQNYVAKDVAEAKKAVLAEVGRTSESVVDLARVVSKEGEDTRTELADQTRGFLAEMQRRLDGVLGRVEELVVGLTVHVSGETARVLERVAAVETYLQGVDAELGDLPTDLFERVKRPAPADEVAPVPVPAVPVEEGQPAPAPVVAPAEQEQPAPNETGALLKHVLPAFLYSSEQPAPDETGAGETAPPPVAPVVPVVEEAVAAEAERSPLQPVPDAGHPDQSVPGTSPPVEEREAAVVLSGELNPPVVEEELASTVRRALHYPVEGAAPAAVFEAASAEADSAAVREAAPPPADRESEATPAPKPEPAPSGRQSVLDALRGKRRK